MPWTLGASPAASMAYIRRSEFVCKPYFFYLRVFVPSYLRAFFSSCLGFLLSWHCSLPLGSEARTALVANTIGFSLLEVSGKRGSILTASGALNAWILGVLLWWTLGRWGWATCVLYLFAGSAVTRVKMDKKEVRDASWRDGDNSGHNT